MLDSKNKSDGLQIYSQKDPVLDGAVSLLGSALYSRNFFVFHTIIGTSLPTSRLFVENAAPALVQGVSSPGRQGVCRRSGPCETLSRTGVGGTGGKGGVGGGVQID